MGERGDGEGGAGVATPSLNPSSHHYSPLPKSLPRGAGEGLVTMCSNILFSPSLTSEAQWGRGQGGGGKKRSGEGFRVGAVVVAGGKTAVAVVLHGRWDTLE